MESPRRERLPGASFTLPSIASMTQGISPTNSSPSQPPPNFDTRDSGNWSMSKHSSTVSSNTGLHLNTILNSDNSPTRFSAGPVGTSQSARAPAQHQPNVVLPALSQSFISQNRESLDASNTSFLDSRRSSIDSRVNVNMGHLAINAVSPYESTNPSQASLVSSLHQQRGMHTSIQPRLSGAGLSPTCRRPLARGGQTPARRAPPIIANPRSGGMPDPMASTPTKGFAWAFPDKPDDDMLSDTSPESSRRASLTASSIHTIDSVAYSARLGRYGEDPLDSHRHSLQHPAVTNLQAGEHAHVGTGNYSRTPELRVSHKLAERKRRSEMKDLFDALNRSLSTSSPGNKSSKWEILSKAVEYITGLKSAYDSSRNEVNELRTELEHAKSAIAKNRTLHDEITVMYQQLQRLDPNGHHVSGPETQFLAQQENRTPTTRLPPLQSSQPPLQPQGQWIQPSAQMQGVEYGHAYEHR